MTPDLERLTTKPWYGLKHATGRPVNVDPQMEGHSDFEALRFILLPSPAAETRGQRAPRRAIPDCSMGPNRALSRYCRTSFWTRFIPLIRSSLASLSPFES